MKSALLAAMLCVVATSAFSEKNLTGLPSTTHDETWREVSVTCHIKDATITQRGWAKQVGVLMYEIDVLVGGEWRARTMMLSGIGGNVYLKSATGWAEFSSAELDDVEKLEVQFPATLGLTPAEWTQCQKEAKKDN